MKWIKCSERMPEEFKDVLLWHPLENKVFYGKLINNFKFEIPQLLDVLYIDTNEITHWLEIKIEIKLPEGE